MFDKGLTYFYVFSQPFLANLQKDFAIDLICDFNDILLMYMPDVKNLHSLLRNIKSSAKKRQSLSVEVWNELLQEVGIPNEESFFKSKGDNWKVPDKPYRYLRLSFKSMFVLN